MKYRVDSGAPHKCLYAGFDELAKIQKRGKSQLVTLSTKRGQKINRHMAYVMVNKFIRVGDKFVFDGEFGRYLADCVTGTLYDKESGKCLTSDQMWIAV